MSQQRLWYINRIGKQTIPIYDRIMSLSPTAYWPLSDVAGTDVLDASGNDGNIIGNPGFEITGTSTIFSSWSANLGAGGGALAIEAADVHAGSKAAKLTSGTTYYGTNLYQDFVTVPGVTYTLTLWTHGDGLKKTIVTIRDVTNGVNYTGKVEMSMCADGDIVYVQFSTTFTAPSGCVSTRISLQSSGAVSVGYFDDISITAPVSTNPYRGTLVGTGTTRNSPGIGDGSPSYLLTGASYITLPWALLNAMSNAAYTGICPAGTIVVWNKFTEAAVWTQIAGAANDKQLYTIYGNYSVGVADNAINGTKYGGEGFLNNPVFGHDAGNRQAHTSQLGAMVGNNWACIGTTWNIATNTLLSYINGVLDVALYFGDDHIGDWTYPITQASIAATLTLRKNRAYMAHCAMWNSELSASDMLKIGKL